jgi:hypothetical protein
LTFQSPIVPIDILPLYISSARVSLPVFIAFCLISRVRSYHSCISAIGERPGLQRGTWLISVISFLILLTFALPRTSHAQLIEQELSEQATKKHLNLCPIMNDGIDKYGDAAH